MIRSVLRAGTAVCGGSGNRMVMLFSLAITSMGWASTLTIDTDPQLSEAAKVSAVIFAFAGFLLSWFMLNGLLGFARDAKNIRLPSHRGLLIGAVAVVLLLTLVGPCALVFTLHRNINQVLIISFGVGTGITGVLLHSWRHRAAALLRNLISADTVLAPDSFVRWGSAGTARGRASWALRTALGQPYAPSSWQRRVAELMVVFGALAVAPAISMVVGASRGRWSLLEAWHANWSWSIWAATMICGVWPLTRSQFLFASKRGSLVELALLPGLGNGTEQRRGLYRAILGWPLLLVGALMLVAVTSAHFDHAPPSVFVRLTLWFLVLGSIPLAAVQGSIAAPGARPMSLVILEVFVPILVYSPAAFNMVPFDSPSRSVGFLRWGFLGCLLIALMLSWGQIYYFWRKLAQRPHPFVETAQPLTIWSPLFRR